MTDEKKSLLEADEAKEDESRSPIQQEYGSSNSSEDGSPTEPEPVPDCIADTPLLVKIYRGRSRIPGYGLWRLFRQASAYSLFVLFVMLMAYLLNQLDRYTLPITAKYVGFDLKFGELRCLPNFTELLSPTYNIPRSSVFGDIIAECRNITRLWVTWMYMYHSLASFLESSAGKYGSCLLLQTCKMFQHFVKAGFPVDFWLGKEIMVKNNKLFFLKIITS